MGVAAAVIGAAVLGGAATAYSVNEQKKAAKKQERRIERQKKDALTEARERSLLEGAREDTGAKIQLGRQDTESTSGSAAGAGAATSRTGSVKSRVGGMGASTLAGGLKGKASKRVGL